MTEQRDEGRQFILDIAWDRPSSDAPVMPRLVGPFTTRLEAHQWARLNVASGSWEAQPLTYPYRRVYGELVERACEVMHDAYEAAAVSAGWETQERSRKPWSEVPEANKETMRAAVSALLDWLWAGGGA